ncbi:MAG: dNTP triphosphohydrolase [Deltaproteobacteria bacterium]|jgi:dGTPase|nr:dNTP triphosphohydrolase [Deltaproteobacteria bacterium]
MFKWLKIISYKRTGSNSPDNFDRTEFQRDFDRLIFSSAFRRLQNKTQVFPLPGSVFVHNRLTHSLEVASVGRSLGKIVGKCLLEKNIIKDDKNHLYEYELQNIIASASLAHDIGNPPFGHSGENAIANYFNKNKNKELEQGKNLKNYYTEEDEWTDLINFEGNANSFRVLTHHFKGKSAGGYRLTYTTLAAMIKYPLVSTGIDKDCKIRKKFGVFKADQKIFQKIFSELQIDQVSESPLVYKRHPFSYLTEAADDICYLIIDLEDAHRLKILPLAEVKEDLLQLYAEVMPEHENLEKIKKTARSITDDNEKICYLRAKCINALTLAASSLYVEKHQEIIKGNFEVGLIDYLAGRIPKIKQIKSKSRKKIYNHHTVVQLEIAGFKVMEKLLDLFVPAVLKETKSHQDKNVLKLLPEQFKVEDDKSNYKKTFSILDFLSGMTDPYITELYKRLVGIEIARHN